ncbi:hypothetical protein O3P69_004827 [Scylla paramamosain]|uniref:Uncharacterized protein n=1 Tax=Scylla paramamosain TaxID=85552 RepID=A0AAW0UCE5_SCYPA
MATTTWLATTVLLASFTCGQRFNVNRGLQRPGVVVGGGRGPQRPVGPGGGVFLNPDFPTSLITPATAPPLPRVPGNPNDFRNPDFPGFPVPPPGDDKAVVPGQPPVALPPSISGPLEEEEEEEEEEEQEEGPVLYGGVQLGSLMCYSCKLDFRKAEYDWSHPCLGRHNGLNVSTDYLVPCGPKDLYCKAERMEVNGVLIYLARECTDTCHFGCRPRGFGISYETCSKCCQTSACNHMYPPSLSPATPGPPHPLLLLTLVVVEVLDLGILVS